MIFAGCFLVFVAITSEVVEYPWTSDGTELHDPSPPIFDVLSYAEYLEMTSRETNAAASTENFAASVTQIETLPGNSDYDYEVELDIPIEAPEDVPEISKYVLLGSVKIPRINVSENLFLGTGNQMNHGIGHLEGTPLPGEEGNAVIAAHRTSSRGVYPFRYLDLLREGDTVIVDFGGETFSYAVFDSFVVNENHTWVLNPIEGETHSLTLVTCDPVLTTRAKNRLIVRTRLERID
jgi:sortase A